MVNLPEFIKRIYNLSIEIKKIFRHSAQHSISFRAVKLPSTPSGDIRLRRTLRRLRLLASLTSLAYAKLYSV